MQLSGPEIERRMNTPNPKHPENKPDIIITPYNPECMGSNSYDVHLADTLRVYKKTIPQGMRAALPYNNGETQLNMSSWFKKNFWYDFYLNYDVEYDPRNPKFLIDPMNPSHLETLEIKIPESGLVLSPFVGYLGSTLEYTETRNVFPYIDGKSTTGRLFIQNHQTAGRGDDGFCGTWTLEIRTLYPTVVYPGMRIGQLYYEEFVGERRPYNENPASHYNGQIGPTAAAAMMKQSVK